MGNWKLLIQNLSSLKTVWNFFFFFGNFNNETVDHVESKLIVENARTSLYVHYLSVNYV